MPQASDELRREMEMRFGDPVSDSGPTKHLFDAGYRLTRGWFWRAPKQYTAWEQLPETDRLCIRFMFDEWDYGGVEFYHEVAPPTTAQE